MKGCFSGCEQCRKVLNNISGSINHVSLPVHDFGMDVLGLARCALPDLTTMVKLYGELINEQAEEE